MTGLVTHGLVEPDAERCPTLRVEGLRSVVAWRDPDRQRRQPIGRRLAPLDVIAAFSRRHHAEICKDPAAFDAQRLRM
jgi:hypothetical protein